MKDLCYIRPLQTNHVLNIGNIFLIFAIKCSDRSKEVPMQTDRRDVPIDRRRTRGLISLEVTLPIKPIWSPIISDYVLFKKNLHVKSKNCQMTWLRRLKNTFRRKISRLVDRISVPSLIQFKRMKILSFTVWFFCAKTIQLLFAINRNRYRMTMQNQFT